MIMIMYKKMQWLGEMTLGNCQTMNRKENFQTCVVTEQKYLNKNFVEVKEEWASILENTESFTDLGQRKMRKEIVNIKWIMGRYMMGMVKIKFRECFKDSESSDS